MEYYCNKGDGPAILRLFRNMRQSTGVFFDSDVYALIIGSLARFRFFCVDGVPIEGARDVGFSSTHGPELFDEIALEMADDLLELSEVAATNIMNGFLEGFAESNDSVDFDGIPTISDAPTSAAIITGRVDIDDKTAKCPVSEAKLRLFALDDTQRQHVHDTLLEMAQLKYMEFTKKKPNSTEDKNYGFEELFHFSEWLK